VPVILIGGIMIGTRHAAVVSITSIYYPSAVRSTGGGWAGFRDSGPHHKRHLWLRRRGGGRAASPHGDELHAGVKW